MKLPDALTFVKFMWKWILIPSWLLILGMWAWIIWHRWQRGAL